MAVLAGFISYCEDSGFSLFLNFSLWEISNIHKSKENSVTTMPINIWPILFHLYPALLLQTEFLKANFRHPVTSFTKASTYTSKRFLNINGMSLSIPKEMNIRSVTEHTGRAGERSQATCSLL